MELRLGAMIVIRGPHGTHDGNIVDAAPHVRHPVAELDAAVAIFSKADLQRIEFLAQFDDDALKQYLEHLEQARTKHLRQAAYIPRAPKLRMVS